MGTIPQSYLARWSPIMAANDRKRAQTQVCHVQEDLKCWHAFLWHAVGAGRHL